MASPMQRNYGEEATHFSKGPYQMPPHLFGDFVYEERVRSRRITFRCHTIDHVVYLHISNQTWLKPTLFFCIYIYMRGRIVNY